MLVSCILGGYHVGEIDYSKCCLCQRDSDGKICNPSTSGNLSPYDTLATDLYNFKKIGIDPVRVRIRHFGENKTEIKDTLIEKNAFFHITCKSKCDSGKFKRAQKRAAKEQLSNVSPQKSTRASANASFCRDEPSCVMTGCTEKDGRVQKGSVLHKASTKQVSLDCNRCKSCITAHAD